MRIRNVLLSASGLTILCLLLVPAASAGRDVLRVSEPTPGPWGEPCFTIDVYDGDVFHQGTCAGKGVLYPCTLCAPLDCIVYVNNSVLRIPVMDNLCL